MYKCRNPITQDQTIAVQSPSSLRCPCKIGSSPQMRGDLCLSLAPDALVFVLSVELLLRAAAAKTFPSAANDLLLTRASSKCSPGQAQVPTTLKQIFPFHHPTRIYLESRFFVGYSACTARMPSKTTTNVHATTGQ